MKLGLESIQEQLDLLITVTDIKIGDKIVNILTPEQRIDSLCFLMKEFIGHALLLQNRIKEIEADNKMWSCKSCHNYKDCFDD